MTRRSALCICLRNLSQCADKRDPGGRVQCSASEQSGDGVWLFACFQNHSLRLEVSHMAAKVPAALILACSSTDCSCQCKPTGRAPYLACLPASMCFPLLGDPDLQRCSVACLSYSSRCAKYHSPASCVTCAPCAGVRRHPRAVS